MTAVTANRLKHESLDYENLDGFLASTVPFVEAALDAGEPIMVAIGEHRVAALKVASGERANRVEFVELETLGASPSRIISTWRRFAQRHPGQSLRGVTEPAWPGQAEGEQIDGEHHESLLALALSQVDIRLLHARDITRSPPSAEARYADALVAVPERATVLSFTPGQLGDVRNYMIERAERTGLDTARAFDLALAVHELATNCVHHGGGAGSLVVWEDPEFLYCEVRDEGSPAEDRSAADEAPGAEERLPAPRGGRGLWLVHQLCGWVHVRPLGTGNAVRVRMKRDAAGS